MNRAHALIGVLVSSSLLSVGCGILGDCAAVCPDPFTLTFVDGSGNPKTGVFGTVGTQAFDCSAGGGHLDAGMLVPCTGNTVTLESYMDHRAVTVSVSAESGGTFSGAVTPKYAPNGGNVCGSQCASGTATVTLQ